MARYKALFRFDEKVKSHHPATLAGIDEAGRGPLAGPVVASAVIFRSPVSIPGLDDSKRLSPRFREGLYKRIASQALIGLGVVSEEVIDRINILQATRLAMRQAVLNLAVTPGLLLIDGNIQLNLPLPQQSIVGGDGRSASIAAASVIAKVYRDHWMRKLDREFPDYGFALHKGYATSRHLEALQLKGPTRVHRRSFQPVWELLPASAEAEA